MNDVRTEQRLLVVDDNQAIHQDFRKIFDQQVDAGLEQAAAALFGETPATAAGPLFRIDSAYQGQEALELLRRARAENRPYAVAFVDVRMPPGWDGIETTARLWQHDPDLQVVICTAYSDYSWDEMLAKLGQSDQLVILKKPFDTIEVLQLASALTEKWRLAQQARRTMLDLEERIVERTRDLEQANHALRTSERLLTEAQSIAHLGSWEWDVTSGRTTWSDELFRIFGLAPGGGSPQGLEGLERIHPDDRAALRAAVEQAVAACAPFELEYRIVRPSGELRVLHCRGVAQATPQGTTQRMVGVCLDITGQKQTELDLSHSNRALKMLSACNEALIRIQLEQALLDRICRIAVEIGGYRLAWVGYARQDAGRSIEPVARAGDEQGYLAGLQLSWDAATPNGNGPAARAIRDSEVIVVEDLERDEIFQPWREAALARGFRGALCLPLMGDDRTFGVLTLYTAEVTSVGLDEIKLLQELADNLAFGIAGIRSRVERQHSQEAVLKIARGVSEGTGDEFFDLLTTSLVEVLGADGGFVGKLAGPAGAVLETVSFVSDAERQERLAYPLAGTASERVLADGLYVIESGAQQQYPASRMLRDFAVEGFAGIRLRRSSGKPLGVLAVFFRQPLQRAALAISTLRIFAGRAAGELERQETDARLREQASLLEKAHDAIIVRGIDDRIRFWNKGAEAVFGWTAEEAIGHSMEELLCDDPASLHEALGGVMETGEWHGNIAGQRRKDGSLATIAAHWSLVRGDNGRPQSILAINTDITQRLKMDERMQQSQRLEAVGQLTGGVAHDFNNLLTVIQGNAELLVEQLGPQPRLRMLAGMIEGAARRGADLTHRLLAFARKQALEPRVVDVRQLLAGMEALLRRTLSEDIELRFVHDDSLWPALVDPAQLEGAVLNLCLNARDAMERGGRLTIETANAVRDADHPGQLVDLRPGRYVTVTVSDTGKGIAPENLKRVFEPFFTTKEFGKGTGLGLSMVYGFAKQSQGHVMIYSEPGQGTVVRLYLPSAGRPVEEASEKPEETADYSGSETILLTEDDDMVRSYAEQQLAGLGYRVITARNGSDALELIRQTPDIDLLFTDVVMPGGISGPELADAARSLRPGIRVLFTSGYTELAIQQQGRLAGIEPLLSKPYRRVDLARKVRAALARQPGA